MESAELYQNNLHLLQQAGIEFEVYEHEPVFSYQAAARIRERFGLSGVESKSLFLRFKGGGVAMLVTVEGERFDQQQVRQLMGSKASICSDAELQAFTGCLPMCACPFGHAEEISLLIDERIFDHEHFIYSPGPPNRTVQVSTEKLRAILSHVPNRVVYIPRRKT